MINSALRLLLAVVIVFGATFHRLRSRGAPSPFRAWSPTLAAASFLAPPSLAKNNATGQTFVVISNESGVFAIPGIAVGTYTVTVTLSGFKTAVLNDVRIITGTPASIKPILEIGALSETVQVSSRAELVQTQSAAVSSTLTAEQLTKCRWRRATRCTRWRCSRACSWSRQVRAPPGSTACRTTPSTSRLTASARATRCSRATASSRWSRRAWMRSRKSRSPARSPARRRRRLRADRVHHPVGHQPVRWQRLPLLAPTRVQLELLLQQDQQPAEKRSHRAPVRRSAIGGPIMLPGLFDGRGKAFFFFNFEHQYQPSRATRTRTMLEPDAQHGIFTYDLTVAGVQQRRTVNLLDLAAANGQTPTFDPTSSAAAGGHPGGDDHDGTVDRRPNRQRPRLRVSRPRRRATSTAPTTASTTTCPTSTG